MNGGKYLEKQIKDVQEKMNAYNCPGKDAGLILTRKARRCWGLHAQGAQFQRFNFWLRILESVALRKQ
jgi:hypothetical protein